MVLTAQEHGIDPKLVSSNAIRVTQGLQDAGFKAFLVGGAVRDLLLGIKPKDFDIATNAGTDESFVISAANTIPFSGGSAGNAGIFYAPKASLFIAFTAAGKPCSADLRYSRSASS